MKLSDQFIDFRRQAEEPVKIVLVGLLLALGANLFNAFGEFVGVLSHAQGQRKFALIANARAIDTDADAEGAVLIAESLEFRLIKDLLESGTCQFIPITGLWFELAPPFGFPVLFLGGLELPAFLRIANELGGIQPLCGSLNFTQGRRLAYFIDQHSGDIGFRAGQITDEFQEADGLGPPQCPTVIFWIVLESLGNLVDVSAFLI